MDNLTCNILLFISHGDYRPFFIEDLIEYLLKTSVSSSYAKGSLKRIVAEHLTKMEEERLLIRTPDSLIKLLKHGRKNIIVDIIKRFFDITDAKSLTIIEQNLGASLFASTKYHGSAKLYNPDIYRIKDHIKNKISMFQKFIKLYSTML